MENGYDNTEECCGCIEALGIMCADHTFGLASTIELARFRRRIAALKKLYKSKGISEKRYHAAVRSAEIDAGLGNIPY